MHILPNTSWQHITMTMPRELWIIFKANRKKLLKKLSKLAAKIFLMAANKKGVLPGIFSALHTFGRDLKWNTHVHLSVTLGGLTEKNEWEEISFHKDSLMRMWRHEKVEKLSYRTLLKSSFGIDPLERILCGSHMVLKQLQMGIKFSKISKHHKDLAHAKFIHVH